MQALFPRQPGESQEEYDKREEKFWRKVKAAEDNLTALRAKNAERMKQ